jgi:autotransporter translocation and assembly factor TamB
MIRRASVRGCAAFVVLAMTVLASEPARAVTFPGDISGTEQAFDTTIDLTGNIFANGNGSVVNTKSKVEQFKFTAPLNHSLSLFGNNFKLSADPKSDPLGASYDFASNSKLVDIDDMELDLLDGQTVDFALDTIYLTTNSTVSLLKSISVDVSGTLSGLSFNQTGPAQILGGSGSGTFSIAGEVTAHVDNLMAVVFGLMQVPIDSQTVVIPMVFQGNWTLNGFRPKLTLDGNFIDGDFTLDIPISLLTNLTTAITDLSANLTLNGQLHLEPDICFCPEPGSVVLLGIGLPAAIALAVHRRPGIRRLR